MKRKNKVKKQRREEPKREVPEFSGDSDHNVDMKDDMSRFD